VRYYITDRTTVIVALASTLVLTDTLEPGARVSDIKLTYQVDRGPSL